MSPSIQILLAGTLIKPRILQRRSFPHDEGVEDSSAIANERNVVIDLNESCTTVNTTASEQASTIPLLGGGKSDHQYPHRRTGAGSQLSHLVRSQRLKRANSLDRDDVKPQMGKTACSDDLVEPLSVKHALIYQLFNNETAETFTSETPSTRNLAQRRLPRLVSPGTLNKRKRSLRHHHPTSEGAAPSTPISRRKQMSFSTSPRSPSVAMRSPKSIENIANTSPAPSKRNYSSMAAVLLEDSRAAVLSPQKSPTPRTPRGTLTREMISRRLSTSQRRLGLPGAAGTASTSHRIINSVGHEKLSSQHAPRPIPSNGSDNDDDSFASSHAEFSVATDVPSSPIPIPPTPQQHPQCYHEDIYFEYNPSTESPNFQLNVQETENATENTTMTTSLETWRSRRARHQSICSPTPMVAATSTAGVITTTPSMLSQRLTQASRRPATIAGASRSSVAAALAAFIPEPPLAHYSSEDLLARGNSFHKDIDTQETRNETVLCRTRRARQHTLTATSAGCGMMMSPKPQRPVQAARRPATTTGTTRSSVGASMAAFIPEPPLTDDCFNDMPAKSSSFHEHVSYETENEPLRKTSSGLCRSTRARHPTSTCGLAALVAATAVGAETMASPKSQLQLHAVRRPATTTGAPRSSVAGALAAFIPEPPLAVGRTGTMSAKGNSLHRHHSSNGRLSSTARRATEQRSCETDCSTHKLEDDRTGGIYQTRSALQEIQRRSSRSDLGCAEMQRMTRETVKTNSNYVRPAAKDHQRSSSTSRMERRTVHTTSEHRTPKKNSVSDHGRTRSGTRMERHSSHSYMTSSAKRKSAQPYDHSIQTTGPRDLKSTLTHMMAEKHSTTGERTTSSAPILERRSSHSSSTPPSQPERTLKTRERVPSGLSHSAHTADAKLPYEHSGSCTRASSAPRLGRRSSHSACGVDTGNDILAIRTDSGSNHSSAVPSKKSKPENKKTNAVPFRRICSTVREETLMVPSLVTDSIADPKLIETVPKTPRGMQRSAVGKKKRSGRSQFARNHSNSSDRPRASLSVSTEISHAHPDSGVHSVGNDHASETFVQVEGTNNSTVGVKGQSPIDDEEDLYSMHMKACNPSCALDVVDWERKSPPPGRGAVLPRGSLAVDLQNLSIVRDDAVSLTSAEDWKRASLFQLPGTIQPSTGQKSSLLSPNGPRRSVSASSVHPSHKRRSRRPLSSKAADSSCSSQETKTDCSPKANSRDGAGMSAGPAEFDGHSSGVTVCSIEMMKRAGCASPIAAKRRGRRPPCKEAAGSPVHDEAAMVETGQCELSLCGNEPRCRCDGENTGKQTGLPASRSNGMDCVLGVITPSADLGHQTTQGLPSDIAREIGLGITHDPTDIQFKSTSDFTCSVANNGEGHADESLVSAATGAMQEIIVEEQNVVPDTCFSEQSALSSSKSVEPCRSNHFGSAITSKEETTCKSVTFDCSYLMEHTDVTNTSAESIVQRSSDSKRALSSVTSQVSTRIDVAANVPRSSIRICSTNEEDIINKSVTFDCSFEQDEEEIKKPDVNAARKWLQKGVQEIIDKYSESNQSISFNSSTTTQLIGNNFYSHQACNQSLSAISSASTQVVSNCN